MNGLHDFLSWSTFRRLCLPLALLFLAPTPVAAEPSLLAPQRFAVDLDEEDETGLFVLGNTLFAVYHELGHALIDLLELPVIGREEDAADGFAAVMMIPPEPDPVRDELIIAVAEGWRIMSERSRGAMPAWDEHALDEQRHFAVICWMVGSDQEGFYDLALEAGMPPWRIESCADDFRRMKVSWEGLLRGSMSKDSLAASGAPKSTAVAPTAPNRIAVIFETPEEKDREAHELALRSGVIEQSMQDFGKRIALPAAITIRFQSCDEANAFWQAEDREVLMCYGLVGDFVSVLYGGL